MYAFWAITKGTFREGARSKLFLGILFFAVLMLLSSIIVSDFSFAERRKIIEDLGLASIALFGLIVTVFVGIDLIHKEIDRRTIYVILSKPIRREAFIAGKYVGLLGIMLVNLAVMLLFLFLLLVLYVKSLDIYLIKSVYTIFWELSILAAIATLFSSFSSPMLSAFITLSFYAIGHSHNLVEASYAKQAGVTKVIFKIVMVLFPNFEYFDIKSIVIHKLPLEPGRLFFSTLYAVGYIMFFLVVTIIIFSRREFK